MIFMHIWTVDGLYRSSRVNPNSQKNKKLETVDIRSFREFKIASRSSENGHFHVTKNPFFLGVKKTVWN